MTTAVAMLLLGACCAGAETRALVVGVSGYPNLESSLHLVGPRNDSREMANTLARLGVPAANITVLADGASGLSEGIANPGPGTKSAILSDLDHLVETSGRGDLVVFYFSGHGSQQPDLDGDEQGGADEVFLPYDVGRWTDDGIENALFDDELGARVDRLLDKGVDFFGVIDACHSSTGFRDIGGGDVRARGIEPALLGVPETGRPAARGLRLPSRGKAAPGRGRAAYFYAAQENEEALEKTPPNAADGESYGVFTYTLLARMNKTAGLTYRTLHQAVMADIKRNTLMATQTPEVEGDLIDEPLLQLGPEPLRRQWPIYNGKLQAGALEGIRPGSLLALFDDPAAGDDKPSAHGIVQAAGATRSVVLPANYPCELDTDCSLRTDPAAWKKARFARILKPSIDLGLVLSEPIRLNPEDGRDYAGPVAALRSALGSGPLATRISQRASGYDIAVGLIDGTLAFAQAAGQIDSDGPGSSPRLTLPSDPAEAARKVAGTLGRMARATALQRIGGDAGSAAKLGLKTALLVKAGKTAPPAGASCSEDEGDYAAPRPAGDDPVFEDCDILSIAMSNDGARPLDVTVLLVGADFSITAVWPVDGNSNRIQIGEKRDVDILQMEPEPKAAARERLIFLAVPGVNRSHVAFTDLEQEGLRAMPGGGSAAVETVRGLLDSGLNDMSRATTTQPARLEEDLSIDIEPFFVRSKADG